MKLLEFSNFTKKKKTVFFVVNSGGKPTGVKQSATFTSAVISGGKPIGVQLLTTF